MEYMKLFDPDIETYLDKIKVKKQEGDFLYGAKWIFDYLDIQFSFIIINGKEYNYNVLLPELRQIKEVSTSYFTILEKFDPDTKRAILFFFGGGPNVWAAFRKLIQIELDMINQTAEKILRPARHTVPVETATRGLVKDRVEFMLDNYFGGFYE
tara:strand:- start:307 stop:768 length:462 start_codon:yes stop_codon:yes gene_type:complete